MCWYWLDVSVVTCLVVGLAGGVLTAFERELWSGRGLEKARASTVTRGASTRQSSLRLSPTSRPYCRRCHDNAQDDDD